MGSIKTLYGLKYSYYSIVLSIQTVYKKKILIGDVQSVIKRLKNQQNNQSRAKEEDNGNTSQMEEENKTVRRSKVGAETKEKWTQANLSNHNNTEVHIFKSPQLNHKRVSYLTVCQVLNILGLESFKANQSFYLGGKTGQEGREAFCIEMMQSLRENHGFFESAIFSDESIICAQKNGEDRVRKLRGQKLSLKYIRQRKKFNGGIQITVWGAISQDSWRNMVWIKSINSDVYCGALEKGLINKQNTGDFVFQQEDAIPPKRLKQSQKMITLRPSLSLLIAQTGASSKISRLSQKIVQKQIQMCKSLF
ncbi:hypothetical protein ABPG73_008558 [Tetrahymena malaccensis]